MHRAATVLAKANLLPAHRREPHPAWMAATRLLLALIHPQPLALLSEWTQGGASVRQPPVSLTIHGFSAGSLNGLVLHNLAMEFLGTLRGPTIVGAIACAPSQLEKHLRNSPRGLHLIHYAFDQLCVWDPPPSHKAQLEERQVQLTWINGRDEEKHEIEWLGGQLHNYAHLPALAIPPGPNVEHSGAVV